MTEMMQRGFKNPAPDSQSLRPSGWSALADTFVEASKVSVDLPSLREVFIASLR